MHWLWVGIFVGRVDKSLVHWWGAQYVDVEGNVHWESKYLKIIFKINQSEPTKSLMFNTSLELANTNA